MFVQPQQKAVAERMQNVVDIWTRRTWQGGSCWQKSAHSERVQGRVVVRCAVQLQAQRSSCAWRVLAMMGGTQAWQPVGLLNTERKRVSGLANVEELAMRRWPQREVKSLRRSAAAQRNLHASWRIQPSIAAVHHHTVIDCA